MKPVGLALTILACAAAGAADWPQAGGNSQHTNSTPDSPAPPYKVAWVADFSPEQIYSAQAMIAEGRVFQTTLNGSLYALDAATGKRLWHFKAGECVWGSAAALTQADGGGERGGKVFVAAWDGLVYGLDAADGKQLWRYDAGEPISGSPCFADGTLFIGTRRGTMLALGLDGTPKGPAVSPSTQPSKVASGYWNAYSDVIATLAGLPPNSRFKLGQAPSFASPG